MHPLSSEGAGRSEYPAGSQAPQLGIVLHLCFNASMSKRAKATNATETDNSYFLKILIYIVLGTIGIKFNGYLVLPAGLLLGIAIAQKDHFAIDRKVEYAILLIAAIIGLTGWGLYLAL